MTARAGHSGGLWTSAGNGAPAFFHSHCAQLRNVTLQGDIPKGLAHNLEAGTARFSGKKAREGYGASLGEARWRSAFAAGRGLSRHAADAKGHAEVAKRRPVPNKQNNDRRESETFFVFFLRVCGATTNDAAGNVEVADWAQRGAPTARAATRLGLATSTAPRGGRAPACFTRTPGRPGSRASRWFSFATPWPARFRSGARKSCLGKTKGETNKINDAQSRCKD